VPESTTGGRRERNKQEKLDRIVAAAATLFAEHGVDDVTTQQIADAADIGTGTLFLYARTKGELLLLVQNAHYAEALEAGRAAARSAAGSSTSAVPAVLALVRPVVACNREQVENGRTYLREMVFGDPSEPNHAAALTIVAQTEAELVAIIERDGTGHDDAVQLARAVSAVTFLAMAATTTPDVDAVMGDIEAQVRAVLRR